ncbi:MAG: RNA polymerase sigma factor [Anaerolineales bacterium]|nr:RNA polymerase sigma factor [Anaerolineales bacterium]
MDSKELLAQCRAGDRVAVDQLVQEYQPQLFRLALSILDDGSQNGSADAQEVTQYALLAALRSLDSYRGEAKLSTWLYSITVNLCRNHIRTRQRRERVRNLFERLTTPIEDAPSQPEDVIIRKQADFSLFSIVQSLNEKHRLPVILRYYHNCSVAEIAQILDIPEGTVHSRLNTARKKVRNCLESDKNKESGL